MKVKSDHRSKFSNLSNWKEEAWKNQGFNGIRKSCCVTRTGVGHFLLFPAPHGGGFVTFCALFKLIPTYIPGWGGSGFTLTGTLLLQCVRRLIVKTQRRVILFLKILDVILKCGTEYSGFEPVGLQKWCLKLAMGKYKIKGKYWQLREVSQA